MVDDPRDVYLFTAKVSVSFTISDADEVRAAALEALETRQAALPDEDRAVERERIEAALSSALIALVEPGGVLTSVPGAELRSTKLSVESGAPTDDLDDR